MTKKHECALCHKVVVVRPDAKYCGRCYRKSPELLERLRNQAIKANKQANTIRWSNKRRHWDFRGSSPELCYITGAYLTDGWISHASGSKRITGFALSGTYPEFVQKLFECMQSCSFEPRYIKPKNRTKEHRQTQYRVVSNNPAIGQWLQEVCNGKEQIPAFIWLAPIPDQLMFIAGLIDGDGCVDKNGAIAIYGTKQYMSQLPALLTCLNIRTGGWKHIKYLPSGKSFCRVSVHRGDFVDRGGQLFVNQKQERMLNPVHPPQTTYPCPKCGQPMKRKQAKQCRECWQKDEKMIEHMRQVNPQIPKNRV